MRILNQSIIAIILYGLFSSAAMAHGDVASQSGMLSALLHLFTEFDHLLVIFAVGAIISLRVSQYKTRL